MPYSVTIPPPGQKDLLTLVLALCLRPPWEGCPSFLWVAPAVSLFGYATGSRAGGGGCAGAEVDQGPGKPSFEVNHLGNQKNILFLGPAGPPWEWGRRCGSKCGRLFSNGPKGGVGGHLLAPPRKGKFAPFIGKNTSVRPLTLSF